MNVVNNVIKVVIVLALRNKSEERWDYVPKEEIETSAELVWNDFIATEG